MRDYIDKNLRVIKKHLNKRIKIISNSNKLSIIQEYKEWEENQLPNKELVWTLPDLTQADRLNNFCRSIKKEIK